MITQEIEQISARDRLLEVAEEAFFSQGYDATSVRALTEAAGVNLALVNYYFGGKRNLYLETLKQRFQKISQEKCSLLRKSIEGQEFPSLRSILTTYVKMHLGNDETVINMQNFLRLISRQMTEDNDAMELLARELVMPIHQLLIDAIAKICPAMSCKEISFYISSVTAQTFHYIRCPETFNILAGVPENINLRETIADHIIEFSLRGFQQESSCDYIP
jgi:AcrR family transcriptional regulator